MARKKAIEVKVGDPVQMTTDVGKYQPIYYAGASGDFNLIHIDAEFGKMVGLGGAILQGLCSMAFVARMATDWAGDPGALKKIKVRFAKPVRPNDTVTVRGNVAEADGKNVRVEIDAVNQDGVEVISKAWSVIELA